MVPIRRSAAPSSVTWVSLQPSGAQRKLEPESGIALEHFAFKSRTLYLSPERATMAHAIGESAAVGGVTSLQRP
jgi:hypothetical protein